MDKQKCTIYNISLLSATGLKNWSSDYKAKNVNKCGEFQRCTKRRYFI